MTSRSAYDDAKTHYLNGRVYLRALSAEDVSDTYVSWFGDNAVTEFLDAKNIKRKDAIDYIVSGRKARTHYMYGIFDSATDEHIGNCKIGPVTWRHRLSDMVVVIGRKEWWGKGLATEAIKLGNQVAWEVFDLRKLSGGIASENVGSIKAYTRGGWVIEATMKGHHLINGEAQDRVVVSCFNPKYFPEAD